MTAEQVLVTYIDTTRDSRHLYYNQHKYRLNIKNGKSAYCFLLFFGVWFFVVVFFFVCVLVCMRVFCYTHNITREASDTELVGCYLLTAPTVSR